MLPTTCGVLPEKCTLRGPGGGEVVTVKAVPFVTAGKSVVVKLSISEE